MTWIAAAGLLSILAAGANPATEALQGAGSTARPEPWPLEKLVRDCDRIVEASVASIEEMEVTSWDRKTRTVRLLDLEVREVLWGEPVERLTVFSDPTRDHVHGPIGNGEVDFWFLERWRFPFESVQAKRSVDRVGPVGIQIVASYGLGRVPIVGSGVETRVQFRKDRLALPPSFVATPMEPPIGREGTWVRMERSSFVGWLRQSLDAWIPSVEVRWMSTSDWHRFITLRSDGRCSFDDDGNKKEERLPPSAIAAVLSAADAERFFDLPADIGRSPGPDSNALELRIRARSGSRSTVIHGPCEPAKLGAERDDTCDRAHRVLHSVPHAKTWIVTGH